MGTVAGMTDTDAAILFDIDGTLVDSTYHHAIAWQRAFARHDMAIPLWRIHRTIGMGGDKLVAEVAGDEVEERHGDSLRDAWREEYVEIKPEVAPLPGATELIRTLTRQGLPRRARVLGRPRVRRRGARRPRHPRRRRRAQDLGGRRRLQARAGPDRGHPRVTRQPDGRCSSVTRRTTSSRPQRAGLRCICLRSGGYSEAELVEAGAALVVDVPEDLIDLDWEKLPARRRA